MVEKYGAECSGSRVRQSFATKPASASLSTSVCWCIVTTSASSPSNTARTCAEEPLWDWVTVISGPPCAR